MKTKGLYLETFGCQMNVVDSERIVALMREQGYQPVTQAELADLILFNTCTVRDKAARKVFGHLGKFKPLKQRRPELVIGLGGCVAQQEGESLLQRLPFLDLVFGTHNIHRLPELVKAAVERRERGAAVDFLDRDTRLALFPERTEEDGVTRFVTVMQGCDNFCSYCIVPHVRGREISRPSGEILAEIRSLAEQGVREVTLLGQNVNSYGAKEAGEISFAELLRRVQAVDGIERIRFTTSHPKDLSDELVDCFGELDKLCHNLQLPLQSGADRILQAMNRGYSRDQYLAKVERLKTVCPDIRFSTDIIVGFPGETEEDVQGTLAALEQVRYAEIYSFLYSPRRGTDAFALVDDTPSAVIQERFDRVVALQDRISVETWAQDVGRILPVLVEGESRQGGGQLFGRTVWNRIVNFAGPPELVGRTLNLRITGTTRNSHLGERVEATLESP